MTTSPTTPPAGPAVGPLHEADLALFDLDGCLVDSTPAITSALCAALVEAGVDAYQPHDLGWCVGPPLFESVRTLLTEVDADVDLARSIVDGYRDVYRATSVELTEVIDGIPDVLAALADDGTRMAVVTSKPAPFAVPLLEGVGLRERFLAVHAPDADELLETKDVTLRRALDELAPDVPPSRAVMIGDRSHDVVAGVACGTRTVGVTWGAGSRDELAQAGPDHLVDHPAELAALFAPAPG